MPQIDLSTSHLISTHKTHVRWVDMDAYQHVNHARYFDYMVEARAALFADILQDKTKQYVLVHVACDYKKAMNYPQEILVKQYFNAISRTTFTLHYSFHDLNDEQILFAVGESVLVSIDTQTGRPIAVPEAVKAVLIDQSVSDTIMPTRD